MAIIGLEFPDLDPAIDADGWQFLWDNARRYAVAVQNEVRRGRTPEQISDRFSQRCGGLRAEMKMRIEQAARHVQREMAEGAAV